MDAHGSKDLRNDLNCLLVNEKYSDLTIRCSGHLFKVHRAIVCSQSTVLAKLEDDGQQQGSTIDLPDENPETVEWFITYLYSGKYNEPTDETDNGTEMCLRMALKLYFMANKFEVKSLMELTTMRFQAVLHNTLSASVDFPAIANEVYKKAKGAHLQGDTLEACVCQYLAGIPMTEWPWEGRMLDVLLKHKGFALGLITASQIRCHPRSRYYSSKEAIAHFSACTSALVRNRSTHT